MFAYIYDWCVTILSYLGFDFNYQSLLLASKSQLVFPQLNSVNIDNVDVIGEGGFSSVFVGTRSSDGKKYAVKKIMILSTESQSIVDQELQALRLFKHENIITLEDVLAIDSDRAIYLAFPLYSQGSLRRRLTLIEQHKVVKPTLTDVLIGFIQIARAFNVLHTHIPSYKHQDIKPEVFP